ncbi:unnamed protein product, partial [Agarophyton chilense]
APSASRAHYEKLSLTWAPLSVLLLLTVVLATPLRHACGRNAYLAISLLLCAPAVVAPIVAPARADRHLPLRARFCVKASLWIAVFSFYGNYFWTHYFYTLLGARYLFDSYRFNDVPVVCFTCTFFYFTVYFNVAVVLLRRLARATQHFSPLPREILWWTAVCVLSYASAVFEAVSIQHFPLYAVRDRRAFLTIGSAFYAIYFIVAFPLFFALDEHRFARLAPPPASLWHVFLSACAASAIVTVLLDFWRLALGPLHYITAAAAATPAPFVPLPFVYRNSLAIAQLAAGADAL